MDAATKLWAVINQFLTSSQLYLVIGLIVLDFLLGVASALKRQVFDWQKLAQFYGTNVSPLVAGYAALYLAFQYIAGLGTVLGNGLVDAALVPILGTLVASIAASVQELYGIDIAPAPAAPKSGPKQ